MHAFLLAAKLSWFADGGFLNKLLDEWAINVQNPAPAAIRSRARISAPRPPRAERNHILPGDPGRVYNVDKDGAVHPVSPSTGEPAKPATDPTSLKAREGNPFTGE